MCVHVLFVAEKAVSRVTAAGIRMASQVSKVLDVSVGISPGERWPIGFDFFSEHEGLITSIRGLLFPPRETGKVPVTEGSRLLPFLC